MPLLRCFLDDNSASPSNRGAPRYAIPSIAIASRSSSHTLRPARRTPRRSVRLSARRAGGTPYAHPTSYANPVRKLTARLHFDDDVDNREASITFCSRPRRTPDVQTSRARALSLSLSPHPPSPPAHSSALGLYAHPLRHPRSRSPLAAFPFDPSSSRAPHNFPPLDSGTRNHIGGHESHRRAYASPNNSPPNTLGEGMPSCPSPF